MTDRAVVELVQARAVELRTTEPGRVELVMDVVGPKPVQIDVRGPKGERGVPGVWTELTQAEYDALSPPTPGVLYLITN